MGSLIDTIESSDWIVFVQAGTCPVKDTRACLLHSVGRIDGSPYLRILVQRAADPPYLVMTRLAHELQHVAEVILDGRVFDAAGIVQLFRQIGYEHVRSRAAIVYETRAAQDVEVRVKRELSARRGMTAR